MKISNKIFVVIHILLIIAVFFINTLSYAKAIAILGLIGMMIGYIKDKE